MRFNKRIRYSAYALAAFLLASCSDQKEELNGNSQSPNGKVPVTVSVSLYQPQLVKASTRASTAADSDIKNFDLVIFDGFGRALERVKVDNVASGEGGTVSFTVNLTPTSEKRIIHLVANGRDGEGMDRIYFGAVNPRFDTESLFMQNAEAPASINGRIDWDKAAVLTPLIMWARFVLDSGITAGTTVSGVKLLRMAAFVQVKKGTHQQPGDGLDDFVIEGISLSRVNIYARLAPTDYKGVAGIPSTPSPGHNPGVDYLDNHRSIEALGEEPSIYVHEQAVPTTDPSAQMFIMLKASYKGVPGYYKLQMADRNGKVLDIIRNHRYILTIVGVNAPGHPTLKAARESPYEYGLKLEVTDEHEDLPIVATRGGEVLALSNDEIILYGTHDYNSTLGYYLHSFFTCGYTSFCDVYAYSPPKAVIQGYGAPKVVLTFSSITGGANFYSQVIPFSGSDSSGNTLWKIRLSTAASWESPPTSTAIMTVTFDKISLPVRITWHKYISPPFQEDFDSYALDLVDPADKNWNMRVLPMDIYSKDVTSALHPSNGSPGAYPGDGMVTELSSKYHSHAYLHVSKVPYYRGTHSSANTVVQKTSIRDGKPVVTRIATVQDNMWNNPPPIFQPE